METPDERAILCSAKEFFQYLRWDLIGVDLWRWEGAGEGEVTCGQEWSQNIQSMQLKRAREGKSAAHQIADSRQGLTANALPSGNHHSASGAISSPSNFMRSLGNRLDRPSPEARALSAISSMDILRTVFGNSVLLSGALLRSWDLNKACYEWLTSLLLSLCKKAADWVENRFKLDFLFVLYLRDDRENTHTQRYYY